MSSFNQIRVTSYGEDLVAVGLIDADGFSVAQGEASTTREALVNALCNAGWDYAEADDRADELLALHQPRA